MTVVADSFCHFYLLDFASQEWVKNYMKKMRLPLLQRLPRSTSEGLPGHEENKLEQILEDIQDLSLANVRSERGFEAYMSETFSKRGTKGSVMQVAGSTSAAKASKRNTMNVRAARSSMRKAQIGGSGGSKVAPAGPAGPAGGSARPASR